MGGWYCKRWEEEDGSLTPEEITRRIVACSMVGEESYLEFTTEVGGDFKDGWFPTLDAALNVTPGIIYSIHSMRNPRGLNVQLRPDLRWERG